MVTKMGLVAMESQRPKVVADTGKNGIGGGGLKKSCWTTFWYSSNRDHTIKESLYKDFLVSGGKYESLGDSCKGGNYWW